MAASDGDGGVQVLLANAFSLLLTLGLKLASARTQLEHFQLLNRRCQLCAGHSVSQPFYLCVRLPIRTTGYPLTRSVDVLQLLGRSLLFIQI